MTVPSFLLTEYTPSSPAAAGEVCTTAKNEPLAGCMAPAGLPSGSTVTSSPCFNRLAYGGREGRGEVGGRYLGREG